MTTPPRTATLPPGYRLRRMRPADTRQTAVLHRRLLGTGLFPRLGNGFVARWHRTFLDNPAAVGLAVVHHGEVVAFALVALDQRLYLRATLRRHRTALLWRGLLGLLVRPPLLLRFLRTRLRAYARHLVPGGRRGSAAPPVERRVRVAVVHAIATREDARGTGCARALLEQVVDAATGARADHVALVTDVADPTEPEATGAAAMYSHLGWERVDLRGHRDGRWVAEYRWPLPPARATSTGPDPLVDLVDP